MLGKVMGTYEVVTAYDELDKRVEYLGRLIHDLNVLYHDSPAPN